MVKKIIERGAVEMGLTLPAEATALFEAYYRMLEKRGEKVNLTAIAGAEDVARLHFLDSLALLKATSFQNARVIDIGSGAGFPGVPLKLAELSAELTLLDATGKRVAFLSDLCAELDIGVVCIHARAEERAHDPDMREMFDVAVSRAVARLHALCELCLPYVRIGGVFLAMKGTDSAEEMKEAGASIQAMGAELEDTIDYKIPETEIMHRIIVIRKTAVTPMQYPRRFAKIQKSPLR